MKTRKKILTISLIAIMILSQVIFPLAETAERDFDEIVDEELLEENEMTSSEEPDDSVEPEIVDLGEEETILDESIEEDVIEPEIDEIDVPEGLNWDSMRLIVGTSDEELVENAIASYDGIYILQYSSIYETQIAYTHLKDIVDFIELDTALSITEITEGSFDEVITTDTVMTETENPFVELENINILSEYDIALIDTGANGDKSVSVLGDDPSDDNGHGELMLSHIRKVNPSAKVLSIKALNQNGLGDASSVYAAIKLAIESDVRIINLSMGAIATETNFIVEEAVREAIEKGITVVCSAGNNGKNVKYYSPARIIEAYTIGSCDEKGERRDFSNFGDVDYNVVSESTSEAAAIFSGIYALEGFTVNKGLIYQPDFLYIEPEIEEPIVSEDGSFKAAVANTSQPAQRVQYTGGVSMTQKGSLHDPFVPLKNPSYSYTSTTRHHSSWQDTYDPNDKGHSWLGDFGTRGSTAPYYGVTDVAYKFRYPSFLIYDGQYYDVELVITEVSTAYPVSIAIKREAPGIFFVNDTWELQYWNGNKYTRRGITPENEIMSDYCEIGWTLNIYKAGTNTLAKLPNVFLTIRDIDVSEGGNTEGIRVIGHTPSASNTYYSNTDGKYIYNRSTSYYGMKIGVTPKTSWITLAHSGLRNNGSVSGYYGTKHTGDTTYGSVFATDFDLYAESYTVTYKANTGHIVVGSTHSETVAFTHSPKCNSNTHGYATADGYTFLGWTCDKNVTLQDGTVIPKGTYITTANARKIKVTQNLTLTANYRKNQLKIRYHVNGGVIPDNPHEYDESNYYKKGSNSLIYRSDSANGTYTITEQIVNYGSTVNLVNHSSFGLSRPGYQRVSGAEWKSSTAGGTLYNQGTNYPISDFADIISSDKTITVYANWTPINYTATFVPNGGTWSSGTGNKTKTYTIEDVLTVPATISRPGYTFTGWEITSAAGNWVNGTNYNNSPQTKLKGTTGQYGNVTFTAQWTPNYGSYRVSHVIKGTDELLEVPDNPYISEDLLEGATYETERLSDEVLVTMGEYGYSYVGLKEGSSHASGTIEHNIEKEIVYEYAENGSVDVKYVNEEGNVLTGGELAIVKDKVSPGTPYETEEKTFPGYVLIGLEHGSDPASGEVESGKTLHVVYRYMTLESGGYEVSHVLKNNPSVKIADDEQYTGLVSGTSYEAHRLSDETLASLNDYGYIFSNITVGDGFSNETGFIEEGVVKHIRYEYIALGSAEVVYVDEDGNLLEPPTPMVEKVPEGTPYIAPRKAFDGFTLVGPSDNSDPEEGEVEGLKTKRIVYVYSNGHNLTITKNADHDGEFIFNVEVFKGPYNYNIDYERTGSSSYWFTLKITDENDMPVEGFTTTLIEQYFGEEENRTQIRTDINGEIKLYHTGAIPYVQWKIQGICSNPPTNGGSGTVHQYIDLTPYGGVPTSEENVYEFHLGKGESVTLNNLPYGANYRVWEVNNGEEVQVGESVGNFTLTNKVEDENALTVDRHAIFTNEVKRGSLKIMPETLYNQDGEFPFVIKFKNNDSPWSLDEIPEYLTPIEGGYRFTREKNHVLEIPDLPYGLEYEICEEVPEGWTLLNINGEEPKTVTGTINKPIEIYVFTNVRYNTLSFSKTVQGNMGDRSKEFDFSVKVYSQETGDTYDLSMFGGVEQGSGVYIFKLKDGDTINLTVPTGYSYTISESDYSTDGYIQEVDEKLSRTIEGIIEDDISHEFVNTCNFIVPTRVRNPVEIEWLILVVALLGFTIIKKYKLSQVK